MNPGDAEKLEALNQLSNDDLLNRVIGVVLDAMLQDGENDPDEIAVLKTLPHPYLVFMAVWFVQGDVNNGGFIQYYFNSRAQYVGVASECLREIGAHATAALVDKADALYQNQLRAFHETHAEVARQIGPSPEEQLEAMETFFELYVAGDAWDDLDKAFFALDTTGQEKTYDLLADYTRKNLAVFVR